MADTSTRVELLDGYSLEIKPDLSAVVINSKGKELASVPAKVRKSESWQQWQSLRKNHRERLKDNERAIIGWMVSGEPVSGEELAAMMKDPAWSAKLAGLLVVGVGHNNRGLILDGNPEKGLGVFTLDLDSEWVKGTQWHVPHPATFDPKELEAWRQCATENGIEQGLPQLLRPLHMPTADEQSARTTSRYASRTLDNAAFISHAFNRRGWATSNGVATYEFTVLREGEDPIRVTACFEYFAGGDYGDWAMECQTGELTFVDADEAPLRMKDVPIAVFSEACSAIHAIISD